MMAGGGDIGPGVEGSGWGAGPPAAACIAGRSPLIDGAMPGPNEPVNPSAPVEACRTEPSDPKLSIPTSWSLDRPDAATGGVAAGAPARPAGPFAPMPAICRPLADSRLAGSCEGSAMGDGAGA